MVRTCAFVMPAETVTPVTTLRRRTYRLFAVLSMRWRVNSYSVFVDVRAVLNKLRFARRARRRVRVNYQRCNQSHRKDDLRENFHVDFPCLHQCHAPLKLRGFAIISIKRLCKRERASVSGGLKTVGIERFKNRVVNA